MAASSNDLQQEQARLVSVSAARRDGTHCLVLLLALLQI